MSYCRPSFASLALYPSLESVGFAAKLERLKWAHSVLLKDPIKAMGSLPSRYWLSDDDLLSAELIEDRGDTIILRYRKGFLKAFIPDFPEHSQTRYKNWAYSTMGTHFIMDKLGMSPKFLGFYDGDISSLIPSVKAQYIYGMREVENSNPKNLNDSQKKMIRDFADRLCLVAKSLNIYPYEDSQILFSESENRPYAIDFDMWEVLPIHYPPSAYNTQNTWIILNGVKVSLSDFKTTRNEIVSREYYERQNSKGY